ncbi:complex I NDUFA9 subunit family protein [Ferruginivarius sediminum]|uniref:Complex I NDUFA9 subunit family protein n=1 Tax=Ferruginivarius sediminum TaxID=2661937 RepID=A0A369TDD4_9PROT|nr:complex I NDUFA9 subunit family protein [Ferruginivarius sediminum]RDD62842.1 complex I NDUFA9 subunit family protein [Ferruginivarius sediminum]
MIPRRVTILGGTGFVGRALAARLTAHGAAVRAASRQAHMADLPAGVEPFTANVRDTEQVRSAVSGAEAVVYLPGLVQARGAHVFRALHVEAPRQCAELYRRAGGRHFVFVSALGVRRDAPAMADRTKAEGEAAVREVLPEAVVVRPSLVFGVGDHFVTATARMLRTLPVYPLIGGGRTRVQPVHVDDLAHALAALIEHSGAGGQIYEIGGPQIFTLRAMVEMIRAAAETRCWLPALPYPASMLLAAALELLPNPPLIRDQVRLLKTDKIVGGEHSTLRDLGISPHRLEDALPEIVAAALRRTAKTG